MYMCIHVCKQLPKALTKPETKLNDKHLKVCMTQVIMFTQLSYF